MIGTSNEKKRVFIDMDGVLAEYRPEATDADYEMAGYYLGLAPRPAMLDAVKYLLGTGEADVFVLSSVIGGIRDTAVAEKNAWLDRYLPQIDMEHRVFPLCGTSKAAALGGVGRGDVLCDDYSHNLEDWHRAGGSAIKIINECNGRKGSFNAGPRLVIDRKEQLAEAVRAIHFPC